MSLPCISKKNGAAGKKSTADAPKLTMNIDSVRLVNGTRAALRGRKAVERRKTAKVAMARRLGGSAVLDGAVRVNYGQWSAVVVCSKNV